MSWNLYKKVSKVLFFTMLPVAVAYRVGREYEHLTASSKKK